MAATPQMLVDLRECVVGLKGRKQGTSSLSELPSADDRSCHGMPRLS
jgi:hypothetical protein